LRWLQHTAGNRATAALIQRACACVGNREDFEECEREHGTATRRITQRAVALQRTDELDRALGALRAAVAVRNSTTHGPTAAATAPDARSRNPTPDTRSRNPTADDQQADDEESVTRDCSVSTGPAFTPKGKIPVATWGGRKRASFSLAASFKTSASWWEFWSSPDPACCSVRQYIKWDKTYHDDNGGPPHPGFPSSATYDTWYEDRDRRDKRYGHRSGPHSDPIADCGDEYLRGGTRDQANGDTYCGKDNPNIPDRLNGTWQFQLKAIDTCNSDKVKATSSVITVKWG
jgi:hypothetical protein